MKAIERQVVEIKKFQKGIQKSKSVYLKNDYSKHIRKLKQELKNYCRLRRYNYNEILKIYDI